jgi:lipid-binding SYLF domain-containing protein
MYDKYTGGSKFRITNKEGEVSMKIYSVCIGFFIAMLLSGPTGTATTWAASADEIDAKANAVLKKFYQEVGAGKELSKKSKAILIFPDVVKAGFVIGGEYGEGALRIKKKTVEYYSTVAGSIGLQIGAQSKTVILMFMDKEVLSSFRSSDGWEIGVDGSVALIEIGAGDSIDTNSIKDPVIGFVFGNKGLMVNLTLEGTKISKIDR